MDFRPDYEPSGPSACEEWRQMAPAAPEVGQSSAVNTCHRETASSYYKKEAKFGILYSQALPWVYNC